MTAPTGVPLTWVIGAGGLLGHAVADAAAARGPVFPSRPCPWGDRERASAHLFAQAQRLTELAGPDPWQVIWCAGAGFTGASREALDVELVALQATLDGLSSTSAPGGSAAHGAVFFPSSVGGVYAGVGAPPYSETSPVAPLSAYGEAKLAAEDILRGWAGKSGASVLIGRIANLYGPGQNVDKPQGLVSQVCAAHLRREPTSIWVSLDTLRDYVFAPDCADLVLDAMDRLRLPDAPAVVTKILATGRPVSIGAVLGELRRVFRRSPNTILGVHPTSGMQSRDLTTRSVVWPELDHRPWTPLPVGVHATWLDLQQRFLLAERHPGPDAA